MSGDREKGFIVIQQWMIELGLTGNELIIFAVIHGFSMDGKSTFNGGLQYLCDATGISRRTAINCLNKLVGMGIINKTDYFNPDKNVTFSNYSVNFDQCKKCTSEKTALVQDFPEGSEKTALGVVKKLHGGSEKIAPIKEIGSKDKVKREVKGGARATRIPPNWQPSPDDSIYCQQKIPDVPVSEVAEAFRDYWTAESSSRASKRDWSAAWRTWVRKDAEFRRYRGKPAEKSIYEQSMEAAERAKALIFGGAQ